ncbi:hypothetical protein C0991_002462 [Blastosporella zonata]|nr:hypothetical protein C0991_002462 [Blastosporella zonata]
MISVPKKSTDEVDWTTPIRNLIAHSYGESPDNYAAECAQLQRCRQDAVRGAGSDMTARDLLYKYFGQLELLELRFPEIKATEVFFEKCIDEKKGSALVAKIAAQAGTMYTSLAEEVKEFMGKGIFDRNWVILIQIKSKYFSSLSQYHRALADDSASKHGDALVRLTLAETLSKEAHRLATSFSPSSTSSPTLPADTGSSLLGLTKTHSALCSERLVTSTKENDLIYHALLPSAESLAKIDGLAVATPVPIHEVFGTPDVQKTIGKELFGRLLPLSVHESASVYSEEKAKLVRGEVETGEEAEVRVKSLLESLGMPGSLARYRAIVEGQPTSEGEVPTEVRKVEEEVKRLERAGGVDVILQELGKLRERVGGDLDAVGRELEIESRECEEGRVKWEHKWTQEPSAGLSKPIRTDLKSHLGALEAAGKSDGQVGALWSEIRVDVATLRSGEVDALFDVAGQARSGGEHLLDLDVGTEEQEEHERAKIGEFVAEIEERLSRLNKIARERDEILKELKEKIQTDDVSHLLLLNRRNTGVEPALFAAELEKFRPFQHRIALTLSSTDAALVDIRTLFTSLRSLTSASASSKRWDERERHRRELVRRFDGVKEGYIQVRDGLERGLAFYRELGGLVDKLRGGTRAFVASRREERETIVRGLEREKERDGVRPPLAKKPLGHGLEQGFAAMNLSSQQQAPYGASPPPSQQYRPSQYSSPPPAVHSSPSQYSHSTPVIPPPPSQPQYHNTPSPLPSSQPQYQQQQPPPPSQAQPYQQPTFLPPPPPRPTQTSYTLTQPALDPYASLGMFDGMAPPPPANPSQSYSHQPRQPSYGQPQQPQQQQSSYGQEQQAYGQAQQTYQSYASAPYQATAPPPPPSQPAYGYQTQPQGGFPPQQNGYQQQAQYGAQEQGYGNQYGYQR